MRKRRFCIASFPMQILLLTRLLHTAESFFRGGQLASMAGGIADERAKNDVATKTKIRRRNRNIRNSSSNNNNNGVSLIGDTTRDNDEIAVQEARTSGVLRDGAYNEANGNDDGNDDGKNIIINEGGDLVFEGEFRYESDVLPVPFSAVSPRAEDLFEFFSDPENRDLVIKGGGNECERIPLTPEWHEEWTSQSEIVNSTPPGRGNNNHRGDPCRNEEILAVYSEVPIVPGLSLRAVSYTGCKTMKEQATALPCYEFTLLREDYQAVGKKAMTWIFDKVTGNRNNHDRGNCDEDGTNGTAEGVSPGRKNELGVGACDSGSSVCSHCNSDSNSHCNSDSNNSRKTFALSRVMLKPFPQDGGCKICYYGRVKLTLSKRFLHFLPLPTGVVRARVNKSIKKQLERECTRSMDKFTRALNQWNELGTTTRSAGGADAF